MTLTEAAPGVPLALTDFRPYVWGICLAYVERFQPPITDFLGHTECRVGSIIPFVSLSSIRGKHLVTCRPGVLCACENSLTFYVSWSPFLSNDFLSTANSVLSVA
jgi:hypothetical protein